MEEILNRSQSYCVHRSVTITSSPAYSNGRA
jgi:hypothetical protein